MIGIINTAYLVSSALAASASLNSSSRRQAIWWLIVSLGLCILGLLRITEAGVWTDAYLRNILLELGWYDHRRAIQIISVIVFALALVPAINFLPARKFSLKLGIFAFYGLLIFAAIRSSSLHWSDTLLGDQIGRVMLSHAIQIVLLLLSSGAALFHCLRSSNRVAVEPS